MPSHNQATEIDGGGQAVASEKVLHLQRIGVADRYHATRMQSDHTGEVISQDGNFPSQCA